MRTRTITASKDTIKIGDLIHSSNIFLCKVSYLLSIHSGHQFDCAGFGIHHFPADCDFGGEADLLVEMGLVVQGVEGESHIDDISFFQGLAVVSCTKTRNTYHERFPFEAIDSNFKLLYNL